MSESLYFIAILPPESICQEITKLKLEIAEKYGSKHALNSPPHITLHMPFKWKDKKIDVLHQTTQSLNAQMESFTLELNGFDFFEPRVVFVNVESNEKLDTLQKSVSNTCRKQLNLDNTNYKDRPFHPHVTIGFRDLKKAMFYEAQKEFLGRKACYEFLVESIHLLKHDGTKWNVV